MALASRPHPRRSPLGLDPIPAILRPLIRAYLLGYATSVGPRLLTLLLQLVAKRRRERLTPDFYYGSFVKAATKIIQTGFNPQRFPTFCAVLAGGSTLLQEPVKSLIDRVAGRLSADARLRFARWLSTFVAAWLGLRLLHQYDSKAYSEIITAKQHDSADESRSEITTVKYAGRTMDLTLFALTRALDVVVGECWSKHRSRRQAANTWTKAERLVSHLMDPMIFASSCGLIMWAWFYAPQTLPRTYNKWITSAANVDLRLIEALRRCRSGELLYGRETGQAPLLGAMCVDYKWPLSWGDPAATVPFPCEIVHMGCSSSCEYHMLSRFVRAWKWSMATYLPLMLTLALRKPSSLAFRRAIMTSARSATFLGVFISLFYYGVCLCRSRLGPKLIGTDVAARQRIDGGLCVGTGCALCGWSVFIETASRRKDMALFVAPRAMATLLPRRYSLDKQWRETLVFAASTAVVFTCAAENPLRVRGVFGRLLSKVLQK